MRSVCVRKRQLEVLSYTLMSCCYRYSVRENLKSKNEEEIISELKLYKQLGGGTLCDLTSIGLRQLNFS